MALRRPAILAPAALLAVAILVVAGLWLSQRGQALPNTSVAGVDVGGMTADEIAAEIGPVVDAREADPVVFTFEDERFEFVPADLGYRIDVDGTVEAALSRGRSNPIADIPVRVGALWRERDIALVEDVDRDALVTAVDDLADQVDRDRFSGAVVADPETLEVTLEEPRGTAEVRRDETVETLEQGLRTPGPDEFELPADVERPTVAPADAEAVAAQVEAAIAEPLVLRVDDVSLTLDPSQLATLLEVGESEDGTSLELRVTESSVEEHLADTAASRFDVTPVDASFVTSRTPPTTFDDSSTTRWSPVEVGGVEVVAGRDGREFVPARAAEQLTEALRAAEREVALEVEVTTPALTTDQAREQQPTHLLSTFTTYYTAGQDRVANIQRLADVVDGALVLPGEQFSINGISGERSCGKGYKPAGTIVRGELVDTCGGGVSQFGTTTFNAAFFSGFPLDQWKAHSFYISRYPMGREATLSFPQLDVVFTNTSDAPVVVRASYTSTSITVSLYGRPIAGSVSAAHGQPYDRRSPTTETRTTSDLPEGRTRTVQETGSDGFKVQVVRRVDLIGAGTDERTITTTYLPQNGIVERGTG
ncbi:VanW family protein [Nitriliruptor alkaliphilus]|uniref:VanW family protein n=1 Tax=Nitriliruptor alkaliphilus TaxID=427918 RepID=UPI0012ECE365|nr:VanW family protein [Nitriliruptor alkaliphilus]